MESRNLRGFKRPPSPRHCSTYNYFAGHPRQGGYMGPETSRFANPPLHPGHFLRPHPPLFHPPDMHEAIQRDIEKQMIKEEIIMAEMARRRELEEEVRAELMMERGLTFRTGNPFLLSPAMGFDHSPMRLPLLGARPEGVRSLEDRNKPSIEERERGKGFESVPLQRGTGDLKISGAEPVSGSGNEKKKIIILPKPDANPSGSKRKAEIPSGGDASELPPDSISKKRVRDWSCELCQVNVTSEIGLSEHIRGKKHKLKEAATKTHKTGKNYSIGLIQKKATETLQIVETVVPVARDGLTKAAAESTKHESEVVKEGHKRSNPKENTFKFWCELCGVRAPCRNTMNKHKRGKKHLKRLANQQVKVVVLVNQAEELDAGTKGTSEKVVEMTLDGESLGDHETKCEIEGEVTAALDLIEPKPEAQDCMGEHGSGSGLCIMDHEPSTETETQECLSVHSTKPQDVLMSDVVLVNHLEGLAGGKDATSQNLIETSDALKSDHHISETQTNAGDGGTRDLSILDSKSVDGAATKPLDVSTNDVLFVYHAEELTEGEKNTTFENVTGSENGGALDISKPKATEDTETENDGAAEV